MSAFVKIICAQLHVDNSIYKASFVLCMVNKTCTVISLCVWWGGGYHPHATPTTLLMIFVPVLLAFAPDMYLCTSTTHCKNTLFPQHHDFFTSYKDMSWLSSVHSIETIPYMLENGCDCTHSIGRYTYHDLLTIIEWIDVYFEIICYSA